MPTQTLLGLSLFLIASAIVGATQDIKKDYLAISIALLLVSLYLLVCVALITRGLGMWARSVMHRHFSDVICLRCRYQFIESANTCPECGYSYRGITNYNTKRLIAVFIGTITLCAVGVYTYLWQDAIFFEKLFFDKPDKGQSPFFILTLLPTFAILFLCGMTLWAIKIDEGYAPLVTGNSLPEAIKQIKSCILKRSRLRYTERDIVEEKLTHQFSEQLKDQSEESIIEAHTASKIRREAARYKRKARQSRHFTWHLWIWSWRGYLVFTVYYFVILAYLLNGKIEPKVDYLAKTNNQADDVPEIDMAWPLYKAAVLKHNFMGINLPEKDISQHLLHDPVGGQLFYRRLLEPQEAFLDELQTISRKPHMGLELKADIKDYSEAEMKVLFGQYYNKVHTYRRIPQIGPDSDIPALHTTMMPYNTWYRDSVNLLKYRARLAAHEGRIDAAINDIKTIITLSRHQREILLHSLDLQSLYGFRQCALTTMSYLLANFELTEDQLNALLTRLDHTDDFGVSRALYERYFFDDLLQRIYSVNGNITQYTPELLHEISYSNLGEFLPGWSHKPLLPIHFLFVAKHEKVKRLFDTFSAHQRDYQQLPLWEKMAGDSEGQRLRIEMARSLWLTYHYMDIPRHMPTWDQAFIMSDSAMAEREAIKLLIALKRYKIKNGTYPTKLTDLIPAYMKTIPLDATSGQPLVYKFPAPAAKPQVITDYDSTRTFKRPANEPLIYGLGMDMTDDGGKYFGARDWPLISSKEQGDWVIWPQPLIEE